MYKFNFYGFILSHRLVVEYQLQHMIDIKKQITNQKHKKTNEV